MFLDLPILKRALVGKDVKKEFFFCWLVSCGSVGGFGTGLLMALGLGFLRLTMLIFHFCMLVFARRMLKLLDSPRFEE